MKNKTKYFILAVLFGIMALTAAGYAGWNIHLQADITLNILPSGTESSSNGRLDLFEQYIEWCGKPLSQVQDYTPDTVLEAPNQNYTIVVNLSSEPTGSSVSFSDLNIEFVYEYYKVTESGNVKQDPKPTAAGEYFCKIIAKPADASANQTAIENLNNQNGGCAAIVKFKINDLTTIPLPTVNTAFEYNGSNQYADILSKFTFDNNIKLNNALDTSKVTVAVKDKDGKDVPKEENGTPICTNAGSYTFKFTINNTAQYNWNTGDIATASVPVTINRKPITLVSNQTLGINYDSKTRTWQKIEESLHASIQVTGIENGDSFGTEVYVVTGNLTNGIFTYTCSFNNNTYSYSAGYAQDYDASNTGVDETYILNNFVGSTYEATSLTLGGAKAGNYQLQDGASYTLKYKTVKLSNDNDNYYTIEDAIGQSGNIITAGNLTSFVLTSFNKLNGTATNYTLSGSSKLIIPHTDGYSTSTKFEQIDASLPQTNITASALLIPNGTKLKLSDKAKIYVMASIAGYGLVGNRGVIMNTGTIECESGTDIYSYGFLKGLGTITAKSGANLIDVLAYSDWSSSSSAATLSTSAFPVVSWQINNISCKTELYNGSSLKVQAVLWGSNFLVGYQTFDLATIIGTNKDENCFFKPSATATEKDYIMKYAAENTCNESIAENNQSLVVITYNKSTGEPATYAFSHIVQIDIYGDYIDSNLNVSKSGVGFETSTSKVAPISNMNICIKNGATLTTEKASYIFLCGTKLVVEGGATLQVNGLSYIAFDRVDTICTFFNSYCKNKVDAECIINGHLSGTGTVGGIIKTTSDTGTINIANTVITKNTIVIKTGGSTSKVYANNHELKLRLYNPATDKINSSFTPITPGEYKGYTLSDDHGWTVAKGSIIFDKNYGDTDSVVKTISNADMPYLFTEAAYPTLESRPYYTLEVDENGNTNWYTDKACKLPLQPGTTIYSGVTLYAKWTPNVYNLNFEHIYHSSITSPPTETNVTITPTTFTVETFTTLNDPVNGNYVFGGWFLTKNGDTLSDRINSLDGKVLTQHLIDNTTTTVYCYWYPVGTKTYTIEYINNNTAVETPAPQTMVSADTTFELPILLPGGKTDFSCSKYFGGWYGDEGFTNKVDNLSVWLQNNQELIIDNKLTLYAQWIEKNSLKLMVDLENAKDYVYDTVYYINGTSYKIPALPELVKNAVLPTDIVYWKLDNSTAEYYEGNEIELNNTESIKLCILKRYEVNLTVDGANPTIIYTGRYSTDGTTVSTANREPFTSDQPRSPLFYAYSDGQIMDITPNYSHARSHKFTVNGINYEVENPQYPIYTTGVINISISSESLCLVEGTLVTLADGTQRKVEDLTYDDLLLVFNHTTGQYEASPMLLNAHAEDDAVICRVIYLSFSDGTRIGVVTEHAFFDVGLNKYVYISEENAKDFVGHRFAKLIVENNSYRTTSVTLTNVEVVEKFTRRYSPVAYLQLGAIVEGLWGVTESIYENFEPHRGYINIFDFDENMRYDLDKMNADIEKYGLYSYDEFSDLIPYEEFMKGPWRYYKVSEGKGKLTKEDLRFAIKYVYNSRAAQGVKDDLPPTFPWDASITQNTSTGTASNSGEVPIPPDGACDNALPPVTTTSTGSSDEDSSEDKSGGA